MCVARAASYVRPIAKEACMAIRRPPDLPRTSKIIPERKRARSRTSSATSPLSGSAQSNIAVSDELRRAMISEAAYLRAEQRGFASGYELEDWLVAEREVDALLFAHHGAAPQ
jgi:Protein of unknown function (DUF2934)